MKYAQLSNGNVVVAVVIPHSEYIDKSANKTFVSEGHLEINPTVLDNEILDCLYDSSAEESNIKTTASFTQAGVDSNGNSQWYDKETGTLKRYTYDSNGAITGEEEV
tara:strand:- start:7 stop:327 length:321 start_codon:yes stop_codon:yes gene_type:complete